MARQLLTCRRSSVRYHRNRPIEFPLTGETSHFQFHRSQRVDNGTSLLVGGPAEEVPPQEQPQGGELAAQGAPQPAVGGDPGDDGGDDPDDDDDDGGDDLEGGENHPIVPRDWIATHCFRDIGDDFLHWMLRDLLHR